MDSRVEAHSFEGCPGDVELGEDLAEFASGSYQPHAEHRVVPHVLHPGIDLRALDAVVGGVDRQGGSEAVRNDLWFEFGGVREGLNRGFVAVQGRGEESKLWVDCEGVGHSVSGGAAGTQQTAEGEGGSSGRGNVQPEPFVDAEPHGRVEWCVLGAEAGRDPHGGVPVFGLDGSVGCGCEDEALEIVGLVGASGSSGGDEFRRRYEDFNTGEFRGGRVLGENVAEVARRSPLHTHRASVDIGGGTAGGGSLEGDEERACGGKNVPVAEDRAAGGQGAQEQDGAVNGGYLLSDVLHEHGAAVLGGGGTTAARGEALAVGHGPTRGGVAFGDDMPGEAAKGDGGRRVGLEDPGMVQAALEVRARRFVAAPGELNQAHDVFDAYGHGFNAKGTVLLIQGRCVANDEF